MKTWKKILFISVVLALLGVALAPTAYAWKSVSHIYAANLAIADALPDGKVTIPPFGEFDIDGELWEALKTEEGIKAFRAGAIGPDGFPDLITGQQSTHPGAEGKEGIWETDDWLWHLWRMVHFDPTMGINDWVQFWKLFAGQMPYSTEAGMEMPSLANSHEGLDLSSPSDEEQRLALAFVHGYLAHAAGDMFGHTWVNYYAEGVFNVAEPVVVAKHIVLEGYVDKHVPLSDTVAIELPDWIPEKIKYELGKAELDPIKVPGNLVIDAPNRFAYMSLAFGPSVTNQYRHENAAPAVRQLAIFWDWEETVRQAWVKIVNAIKAGDMPDWVKEEGVQVVNGYFVDWVGKIQEARVRYVEASELADLCVLAGKPAGAIQIYSAWWEVYGQPATGIPDWLNIEIIPPDWKIKILEDIVCWVAGTETCQYLKDFQEWVKQPEAHIDTLFDYPQPKYNGKFHKIIQRQMGVTETEDSMPIGGELEKLKWEQFAPLYNTVMLIKLTMLPPSELNRLFREADVQSQVYGENPFGDPYWEPGKVPNAILGAMRSLDGCEQWQEYDWEQRHFGYGFGERQNLYGQFKTGFRFWQDCEVREKVFLKIFKGMDNFGGEFPIRSNAPIPMQVSAGADVSTMSTSGGAVEIQLRGSACGGTGNLQYTWSAEGVTWLAGADTLTSRGSFPTGTRDVTLTVRDSNTGEQQQDTLTVQVWGLSDRISLEQGKWIAFTYTPDLDVALTSDPTGLGGNFAELRIVDPTNEVLTCRRLLCESQDCPPGENRTPCILRQGETRRIDIIPINYPFSGYLKLQFVDAKLVELPQETVIAGPFAFDVLEGEQETFTFQALEDGEVTARLTWAGGDNDAILQVSVYDDQGALVTTWSADALMVQQEMASGMPGMAPSWSVVAGKSYSVEVKSTGRQWIGAVNVVPAPAGAIQPTATAPPGQSATTVWQATQLSHGGGSQVGADDWQITSSNPNVHMAYGPYIRLEPGPYAVVFYLKVDNVTADNQDIVKLDATADNGAMKIVSGWLIPRNQFGSANVYKAFETSFGLSEPADKVEFRVFYYGNATVTLDRIELKKAPVLSTSNWQATQLSHGGGGQVGADDWQIAPSQPNVHMAYGPYISMSPSQYLVRFYLKVDSVQDNTKPLVKLDITANDGSRTLAERDLTRNAFAALNTYQPFTFYFSLYETMNRVEFRVYHYGRATVTLDRVEMEQLDYLYGTAAGRPPLWLWPVLALVVLALAGGMWWWQRSRKRMSR